MSIEIKEFDSKMLKTIEVVKANFASVRAGRANAGVLDRIMVEYYGTPTPLNQVAAIASPDPRTLTIQPWDASAVSAVEKAIKASNLGIMPNSDGRLIRLPIPELSEDRRKTLVKQVKARSEDAKVAVRNARRDGNEAGKKAQKDGELTEDELKKLLDDIQKATDKHIADIDKVVADKEKELLTV